MEQAGYQQHDLAKLLGSRSRASEIMSGSVKRLSVTQMRRLHEAWKIPAEILIRDVSWRAWARPVTCWGAVECGRRRDGT